VIIIDVNEARNHADVAPRLEEVGIEVEVRALEAGDFIVVGPDRKLLIERKSVKNFVTSLESKQLYFQLEKMKASELVEPRILIEGIMSEALEDTAMPLQAVHGAVSSVIDNWKVPVYWTGCWEETIMMLKQLHHMVNKDNKKVDFTLRVHKKNKSSEESIQYVLEGLDGVGPKVSKNLLESFGSLQGVLNAPVSQLKQVPGIGKATAARIFEVLHYGEGRDPKIKAPATR
jgi:ERCC4-type nuclease